MVKVVLIGVALLHLCLMVTSSLVPVAELHPSKPYKFGYAIKDKHGEQYREEAGDGLHEVKGSYGFVDERGIKRQVNYVADKEGFRAEVKTNEPGTAPENPASVKMISTAKALEAAATEVVKKESKVSTSELEKYFKAVADAYNLEKSLGKESIFGKGMEVAEESSAIEKEFDKVGTTDKVNSALEKLFKDGFKFSPYLGSAGLPFYNKELGKESLLFDEASILHKLGGKSITYSPLMAGHTFGSHIPLKNAMNIKGLGMEHLLKGIALAPAASKNALAFIPIYGF